jgi:hypothetical protein
MWNCKRNCPGLHDAVAATTMVIMAVVIFFNINIRMLTITVNLHMA